MFNCLSLSLDNFIPGMPVWWYREGGCCNSQRLVLVRWLYLRVCHRRRAFYECLWRASPYKHICVFRASLICLPQLQKATCVWKNLLPAALWLAEGIISEPQSKQDQYHSPGEEWLQFNSPISGLPFFFWPSSVLGCLTEPRGYLALAQELKSCSLGPRGLQANLLCPTEPALTTL